MTTAVIMPECGVLLFFEGLGNELEVVDNVDVLGALGFTLSTLEALTGTAMALGDEAVIEFAVAQQVGELLHRVIKVEVPGNGNLLGTALGAIPAGGTWNGD